MARKARIAAVILAAVVGGLIATTGTASADPISTILHEAHVPSW